MRGLSPSTQRASSGRALDGVSPSLALISLPQSCERASGCVNITATAGAPSNRRALQSTQANGCWLPISTWLGDALPGCHGLSAQSAAITIRMAKAARRRRIFFDMQALLNRPGREYRATV